MEILITALLFLVMPVCVCCYAADRDGKNVWIVMAAAFFFSWLGGIVAWYLCQGTTPEERIANEDAELERQREEAALRAMGKLPARPGERLSEARKRELEGLLGGKR